MPIFEHDDEFTQEEFARQQSQTNLKIARLAVDEAISTFYETLDEELNEF